MKVTKRIMAAGLMAFAAAAPAFGDAVTDNATFNLGTGFPPSAGPLVDVRVLGLADPGRVYTNTFDNVGQDIRSIGAAVISTAQVGVGLNDVGAISDTTSTFAIVAVFGVQGSIQNVAGSIAEFHTGRLALFAIPTQTFIAGQPDTWGFTTGQFLGEYQIVAPQDVLNGSPEGFPIAADADDINRSAANILSDLNQGRFLFEQVLSDEFVNPAVDFQINANPLQNDGLYVIVNQAILDNSDVNQNGIEDLNDLLATGTNQATANAIGQWAFGGDFANFAALDSTNFTPSLTDGDFGANLSGSAYPVSVQAVPEPATLSLLALGGLGLLARRRNRMA